MDESFSAQEIAHLSLVEGFLEEICKKQGFILEETDIEDYKFISDEEYEEIKNKILTIQRQFRQQLNNFLI